MELFGQILGVIAVAFTCLSYQMQTSKKLLFMQTAASAVFCIHYWLIGAYSGLAINAFAIVRNLAFYHRDKKFLSGKAIPWIFAVGMAVIGTAAWQGWYTLLITVGVAINTVCLAIPNAQSVRKSILVTSPMVFLYDVFAFSVGGMINETLAVTSSVIGILRYRKAQKIAERAADDIATEERHGGVHV